MIPRLLFDSFQPGAQHVLLCGIGKMGRRHADILRSHPAVSALSVYDPYITVEPAPGVCQIGADDLERVAGSVDLAIVATPTATHGALAEMLIGQGVPCLIEKPMTITLAEHARIERLASEHSVPVAVGFVERFNPVVVATKALLHAHRWDTVRLSRFNPGSARLSHESVVADLMVHDIDLAINVLDEPCTGPVEVQATSMAMERADYVIASYEGRRSGRVELCCGRFPGPVVRQIEASGPDGDLLVDLLRRRFYFTPKSSSMGLVSGWEAQNAHSNALKSQFDDFLALVAHGSKQVIALPQEAYAVQQMVELIEHKVDAILAVRRGHLSLVA